LTSDRLDQTKWFLFESEIFPHVSHWC